MEQTSLPNCEEREIDLSQYIKVLAKHKKTFLGVFLIILAIGLGYILFSPKIYRASMMIQPPVGGEVLTGANDLESAERLKALIVNNGFNDDLRNKFNLGSENIIKFRVEIPERTNILQISVDRDSKTKEFGIVLLRNLIDLISNFYAKRIEVRANDTANQIKQNERAIANAKDKAKNLQDQINGITAREEKLREEIKTINANTAEILDKREGLLKNNVATDNVSVLLLTNFIQNNLSYSNQLNNQLSDLSIRRGNLNLEIKSIDFQLQDFQMAIDKLTSSKIFVSNLRILSQPRVSPDPISPNKPIALAVSLVMGLFFGACAAFLQESWENNLNKKRLRKQG
jgi:uncharacterized protein involved in exopolysaccharide biosynthesis